ncbi:MAG: prepilin peptidase [Chloroflexi bacterium]|nr:MAG: prepilin peptidase [Chloroflexota bacterium]
MIFLAALIGFAFGHVVHLVFDRFFSGEPLRGPFYECPACRSPITATSAIPYATIVLSGGRCPKCGEKLPWRAVILPAGAAGLFALSYLAFDEFGAGLLGGFFATVFLTLTFTDLERRLLPNRIVYPSILLAIAFCWAWPDTSWVQILAGGAVAIGIAVLIYLFSLLFGPEAFGMGDVKMIVLIGFVVGFPAVIVAVLLGTIAAGIVAAVLVVTRIRGLRDYVAHGPFLAFGAVLALFATA